MSSQKKFPSRQEILRQRQQSTFVGREEYLASFRYNLTLPPVDWCFLFNVWGQGGVGKSTLLRQFRAIAEQSNCLHALTNDSETTVIEAMARLAGQLPGKLPTFTPTYQTYCKYLHEFDADLDAPQGIRAYLGRTLARTGTELVGQIPIMGAPMKVLLEDDVITNRAGAWASYVAKKVTNKDDRQLMQDPIATLTPLFLQDLNHLAAQTHLLLLFDTYECTSAWLDPWLRDILEGQYGDLPVNLILVIAGRDPLDKNRWTEYESVIARISLQPFTETEIKDYLTRKGITNPQVIEVIVQLSGGLPLLVATLAAESPSEPSQVGNPSGTAVDRFLKWVDDPKRRQIALDAALPRWLNRDVIAVLHGEENADELFTWLQQMPFVEERPDGWIYHDIARTQMLRHKRLTSPQSWVDLHEKLAEYYEKQRTDWQLDARRQWDDPVWQTHSLHVLYHRICKAPHQVFRALDEFVVTLWNENDFPQRWAEIVMQSGQHTEITEIQSWGKQLVEGLKADTNAQYDLAVQRFTELFGQSEIPSHWKAVILLMRGRSHLSMDRDKAAFEDINQAVQLDPNYAWALSYRGIAYRRMGNFESALQDLNQAIELHPDNPEILARRGATYGMMGSGENALQDFSRAVQFNPTATWIIHNLGCAYRLLKRYDEALQPFSQVIALEPNSAGSIQMRGKTYLNLKRFKQALEDFNRAIELEPDDASCFRDRSVTYLALNQPDDAKADLDRAIELAQQVYNKNPEKYRNALDLAFCYVIKNNFELAKHFYRDALHRNASQWVIRQKAIGSLENFLTLFPNHSLAQQMKEALEKHMKGIAGKGEEST